jgi:hypothetical protein
MTGPQWWFLMSDTCPYFTRPTCWLSPTSFVMEYQCSMPRRSQRWWIGGGRRLTPSTYRAVRWRWPSRMWPWSLGCWSDVLSPVVWTQPHGARVVAFVGREHLKFGHNVKLTKILTHFFSITHICSRDFNPWTADYSAIHLVIFCYTNKYVGFNPRTMYCW